MMDYFAFLAHEKILLVAPAGYGKTFTLTECLKHTVGKSLVLTHTHAGVASINKKLKVAHIDPVKYNVETISSFAQKYTTAFYTGDDIPAQEDGKKYHPFILEKATEILSRSLVREVVQSTYSGLFVDEYQDCSMGHHNMIMALGNGLPVRVFGDPLQGIFDFNGDLVDFSTDLHNFETFPPLSVPHRWNLVGKHDLGNSLKLIREKLEAGQDIDLRQYTETIDYVTVNHGDLYNLQSSYRKKLNEVRRDESLLVIHPNSINKAPRIKFSKMFREISSIESIDDRDFYKLSKIVDNIRIGCVYKGVRNLAYELFSKSELDKWFNTLDFKKKRGDEDKRLLRDIQEAVERYSSIANVSTILETISKLPCISCERGELLRSLNKAILLSEIKGYSVYEGMIEQRNVIRRSGRRIEGRHIGTTLLTKGLEFDTVAVMDAHEFKSPKHLYVALTRCRRRLVVFSNSPILSPYE